MAAGGSAISTPALAVDSTLFVFVSACVWASVVSPHYAVSSFQKRRLSLCAFTDPHFTDHLRSIVLHATMSCVSASLFGVFSKSKCTQPSAVSRMELVNYLNYESFKINSVVASGHYYSLPLHDLYF